MQGVDNRKNRLFRQIEIHVDLPFRPFLDELPHRAVGVFVVARKISRIDVAPIFFAESALTFIKYLLPFVYPEGICNRHAVGLQPLPKIDKFQGQHIVRNVHGGQNLLFRLPGRTFGGNRQRQIYGQRRNSKIFALFRECLCRLGKTAGKLFHAFRKRQNSLFRFLIDI